MMTTGEKMIWASAYVVEYNRSMGVNSDHEHSIYIAIQIANAAVHTARWAPKKIEKKYGDQVAGMCDFLKEMIREE